MQIPAAPPGFPPIMSDDKQKLVRRKFSSQEDQYLKDIILQIGTKNWNLVASHFVNRSARQCRERWKNYLSPSVNNKPFTQQEDDLLIRKFKELGKQWSKIAKCFQDRTDVNIKNRWVTLSNQLKRKTMVFENITPIEKAPEEHSELINKDKDNTDTLMYRILQNGIEDTGAPPPNQTNQANLHQQEFDNLLKKKNNDDIVEHNNT